MVLRHQLAVYSPVSLRAGVRAAGDALSRRPDPRGVLLAALLSDYAAGAGVLCGSGTQALQLALVEARERGGDAPVALPAFTCYDVAAAAVGAGVRVALYDVDPDTLSPDLASLERVLADGAGSVVAGPLYGVPPDWDAVRGLSDRYGALLIEDAAQGHGSTWRERPLGSLGDLRVLSFGRGKGWTGGRGGALLFGAGAEAPTLPAPGAADEAKTAVLTAAQWLLGRPEVYGIPASIPGLGLGETVYHEPSPPSAITRAAAALLLHGRDASRREGEVRRAVAASLLARLPRGPGVRPVRVPEAGVPGYLRLPLRAAGGMSGLAAPARARRLGVAGSYPTVLSGVPQLRRLLAGTEARWPGAEALVRELVTLPTHSRVTDGERAEILAMLPA